MGACAGLAVVLTLDGPGLTIDEPLDVRPGRTYMKVIREEGLRFFDRKVVDRVFRDNAEHPPLGRWLLGIASTLGEPFEVIWKGPDPTGQYVLAGRLAPAVSFAALVGVVTLVAGRRWGLRAGVAAGFALAGDAARLRPRPPGGARYVPEPFLDGGARCGRAFASARRVRSARWRSRGRSGRWPS